MKGLRKTALRFSGMGVKVECFERSKDLHIHCLRKGSMYSKCRFMSRYNFYGSNFCKRSPERAALNSVDNNGL